MWKKLTAAWTSQRKVGIPGIRDRNGSPCPGQGSLTGLATGLASTQLKLLSVQRLHGGVNF